ncbi:MAG: dihydrolipoamide acetyltransferase family protein [Gammaproteobacteria bacterium]
MATELLLPQWSMGMHEGKILKWLKQEGDRVTEGEIIAEVESSKVVSELMADRDGVLVKLLVAEEQEVPVRTPLCLIGDADEVGKQVAESDPVPDYQISAPAAQIPAAPVRGKVQVTPPARKLARQHGIDLERLTGSGPNGRIVIEDVEAAIASATPPAGATDSGDLLTGLRATIANNMTRSLQQAAQLTLTSEVDVSSLVELRKSVAASYGDMIAYALSRVLPDYPRLNALITASPQGDRIQLIKEVNLGFAVALDDGLVVPVIQQANLLCLSEIAARSAELAAAAKKGELPAAAYSGGSFTISNLGAYGVDAFTPIINPPQAAILGIGRVRERPLRLNGELVWQRALVLSLTFDHRITDGAPAAKMLQALAAFIADGENFS